MTKEDVLNNLKELIGQEFDDNEVICAFEDYEEEGETYVCIENSNNIGYEKIAYINTENSVEFLFDVDKNDIIMDVRMWEIN